VELVATGSARYTLAALEIRQTGMTIQPKNETASYLRRAADRTVTKADFYVYFRNWMADNPGPLTSLVFEEVEHFWPSADERKILGFRIGAPKNIQENNKQRLRILARSLEEGWDAERTRNEVDRW
jgi:hypothetical protein